ncbi:MAG: mannose-1-phosphate guanylyltransferase [Candidatus Cloacimonadota bacterium]|nr:MAG: mannose-1-phosphate guanylyltransferase [Candidatus Cloacimonadota bacterium]
MSIISVIMAGGVGSRFFPLSTEKKPKQFLSLFSKNPMISDTYERILPIIPKEDILISTNSDFVPLVLDAIDGVKASQCVKEPCGRNTAPALGLIALLASKRAKDCVVVSLHSDHHIIKEAKFLSVIQSAIEIAKTKNIVTLGIEPSYPETGYGYIQADKKTFNSPGKHKFHTVGAFKEKPDIDTAQKYIDSGNYFWNSGMFIFRADHMLEEMKTHCFELYQGLMELDKYTDDLDSAEFIECYKNLPSISIDVAVMENSKNVNVIPCEIGWSDVGSYLSLHKLKDKDENQNVLIGDNPFKSIDSSNNLIVSEFAGKKIGILSVKDLMIIDSKDFLLIGNINSSQLVKEFK